VQSVGRRVDTVIKQIKGDKLAKHRCIILLHAACYTVKLSHV